MTKYRKNIALIGFMGCGKTVIGRMLANKMKYNFIDCDMEIQKNTGMTIPYIFEEYGESYFRQLEKTFIYSLETSLETVISTGGGAVKDKENIRSLKEHSNIIYLKSMPSKLYKNTLNDNNRPLLNVPDRMGKIKELLEQREPLYLKNADIVIDITDLEINEAADAIIDSLDNC